MMSAPGPISADALCAQTFVRHVEIHDELPSTNDRAMQLTLFAELETPALIIARRQLSGRGRGTHAWWSADGALTFSLILEPASWGIARSDWPKLSLTTAVAVCDAIDRESPAPCSIKWPNDVLIGGAKVSGILVESPGGPAPAKDRVVIGVGINVNNSWRNAPREAGPNGIALRDVTGREHDSQAILAAFLQSLDRRLHQLGCNDPELPYAWRQLSWLDDQHVEADIGNHKVDGLCLGIADDGALLVETLFATERIYSGSVRARP
jgi:BirA family transcriptional regulator, biotin operon repressor / biotin---[acetyl-CoA-carboxylase] ligase